MPTMLISVFYNIANRIIFYTIYKNKKAYWRHKINTHNEPNIFILVFIIDAIALDVRPK